MKSKSLGIFLIIIMFSITSCSPMKKNKVKKTNDYIKEYYSFWKKNYVVSVNSSMSRVVNVEDRNSTVSEGMGYGLMFSAAMDDKLEFEKLWKYTNTYLNSNGLMDWKIDKAGKVIGKGSAADADQDITYGLLLAGEKWNYYQYTKAAINMINAIKAHEISGEYKIISGDSWGQNNAFNPSYVAPLYYSKFGKVTSESGYWKKVFDVNINLLKKNMNPNTGLIPDWINGDGSIEKGKNIFGYEAVRIPLRLIMFYKETKDTSVKNILELENSFFKSERINNLKAGYTIEGQPIQNYINTVYLSAYTSASLMEEGSSFNSKLLEKLKNSKDESYYGCSLKLWTFLIIDKKLR